MLWNEFYTEYLDGREFPEDGDVYNASLYMDVYGQCWREVPDALWPGGPWRQSVDIDNQDKAFVYVNVYLADRAYGGPEEGGWWYNTTEVVQVIPCVLSDAPLLVERLEADEYSNEDRRPINSVLSEGEYQINIELRPGRNIPAARPVYC